MPDNYEDFLKGLSDQYGASVESSDLDALRGKKAEDVDQFKSDLTAQYKLRGEDGSPLVREQQASGDGRSYSQGGPGGSWTSLLSQWKGLQPAEMQQFSKQFTSPGRSAMGTAQWTGGNFDAPQLKDIADWTKQFTAPTEADMMMDPGYKFRVDEGRRQLEASAAARGTLLTGGTLDSLGRLGQDYASQEYKDVYGRRLGEFQDEFNMFNSNRGFDASQNTDKYGRALQTFGTNYGLFGNERQNAQLLDESDYSRAMQEYLNEANIFQQNESNRYNSGRQNMMDLFGIDTGLYGRDFGERQQGFAEEMGRGNLALQTELGRGNLALQGELGRGNLGLGQQQFDLSKILGLGGLNLNQQQFGESQRVNSFNMFNTMDQNYINNLMGMGQLGIQAGNQINGAGTGVSDLYTQLGNVLGAGRVGSGNPWGQAVGQTGNNIADQAALMQAQRQSSYNAPYNPYAQWGSNERRLQ